jgi:serine protease Do
MISSEGQTMSRLLIAMVVTLTALQAANEPALARAMQSGDAAVAAKATPAVVNIATWKMRPPLEAGGAPRRVKTYGSGFIIDPSGIIVTNRHVIDGSFHIKVIFHNGDEVDANVVAITAIIDLAVLKVNVSSPLPALNWGDSRELRVGEPVLAIGNPLGFGMSVSAGIVSALNRDIQDTPFDNYIQTDAAINHGNSGGPLVNLDAEVIGIDTALYNPDQAGGFIGIGLAIPAETVQFVLRHLLDPKQPKPGWIGVKLQDLTPDLAKAAGLSGAKGAMIAAVEPGGPGSRASLRPGDVLLAVGPARQTDSRAFIRTIVQLPIGQPAALTVWRDGREQIISATVAEWPRTMPEGGVVTDMAEAMGQKVPDPGMRLVPLTDPARKQYGLDETLTGALVASVEPDCEARDLGIVTGDVITATLGESVATPDDVRRAIRTAHEQRRPFLALLVQGRSGARWVPLSISSSRS